VAWSRQPGHHGADLPALPGWGTGGRREDFGRSCDIDVTPRPRGRGKAPRPDRCCRS